MTGWWDDDLPAYLEDVPTGGARPGLVADVRAVATRVAALREALPERADVPSLIAIDAHREPCSPSVVVSHVVPVPPRTAAARLAAWCSSRDDAITFAAFTEHPSDDCLARVDLDLRASRHRSWRLTLALSPWSTYRSELQVRPVGRCRAVDRYYRAAHAVLDRAARALAPSPR